MDSLKKLNVLHKSIMVLISSSILLYKGSLKEGWDEFDHIQHTSDNLPGKLKIFERQTEIVFQDIQNENKELLKKSLKMYIEDRELLKRNIQTDQVDKNLFENTKDYIDQLNGLIEVLKEAIKD